MAGFGGLLRVAYLEMPPVTRAYTTACVLTTLAVQMDIVSPFQLYYNPVLIGKGQYEARLTLVQFVLFSARNFQFWRVVTTFLFFGNIGLSFIFNMMFTYK